MLRAELHERFAAWLEQRAGERASEYDEILGYHLAQAHHWLGEIGASEEETGPLALRAAERLEAAGRRASDRGDGAAIISLLSRACLLLPTMTPARVELLTLLAWALSEAGEMERSERSIDEALELAAKLGERVLEARAVLTRVGIRRRSEPETLGREAERALARALPVLERAGDERGLGLAEHVRADRSWYAGRFTEAEEALERMLGHARAGNDPGIEQTAFGWLTSALLWGPAPVDEGISRCETIIREVERDRVTELGALAAMAPLEAMRGQFEEARQVLARAREICIDYGLAVNLSTVAGRLALVEMLAGEPGAAETALRGKYEAVEQSRHRIFAANDASGIAQALYAQSRFEEAEEFTRRAEEVVAADDAFSQILVRSIRAKLLARRGDAADGERAGRGAVDLAATTDALNTHADACVDLAEVLRLARRPEESARVLRAAIGLYERKGNVVSAARSRGELERLRATSATL